MSGAAKGILEAAMKLDPREREELIEKLSASLDATDLVNPVPAEDVFERLAQRFRGK
jgi:hypothetical protein